MVEVESGTIEIDGVNVRDIGLSTLRGKLALVPQESTLFVSSHIDLTMLLLTVLQLGTLRENLWVLLNTTPYNEFISS
jgi:ABC-type bacteriocin/lantibiotic exporter with double-glycine peptidase domain